MSLSVGFALLELRGATDWLNAPQGLEVIAIHRPREPLDMDIEKVRESAKKQGVTEPCAIANEHTLGNHFQVMHGRLAFCLMPTTNCGGTHGATLA